MPAARVVEPIAGTLDADVTLPGSKSLTNRALVVSALAAGHSVLHNCGMSDDIEAMIGALHAFGVGTAVHGSTIHVSGSGGSLGRPIGSIDARQSGTTARFVAPMLLRSGGGVLDGHDQLRARPIADLLGALRQLGATTNGDRLPVEVTIDGPLQSTATIGAGVSSQFISGLLLTAPTLPDGLHLRLGGVPVSTPYIEMTISVMKHFGADVTWDGHTLAVEPTGYTAAEYDIEPDASTATYPLAAAAMVGGRVRVVGLGLSSVQGDLHFATVLSEMGANVRLEADAIEVRGSGTLRAITADLADISDTAPTFAALAACASGTSAATGIGFIRESKESDRVLAAVTELNRLGIEAWIDDDGFSVVGGRHRPAVVETYDDHRIAMAMSLLGLIDAPVTIADPSCVHKTFPGFFEMLDDLARTARTEPLVLAIDGPAGSGKSTVATLVAEQLNLPHLDTGAMYRAVTLAVLRAGIPFDDEQAVSAAAENATIRLGADFVLLDGEDVTTDLRSPEVTAAVSPVAVVGGVRSVLAAAQRRWAADRGAAVVEGRDIGSAVFPEATLKVYLDASVEERARRRAAELGKTDIDDMIRRIEERDHIDSTREHDPLTIADGAIVIDSTELHANEVVEQITSLWADRRVRAESGS